MPDLGIDFGTSTTLVSAREGSELPRILPIGQIQSFMPSVAIKRSEGFVAGEDALGAPQRHEVIRWAKMGITTGIDRLEDLGYDVADTVDSTIAAILIEALVRARRHSELQGDSVEASLSCPSSWGWPQRQRLLAIASRAGIDTRGRQTLVDEPVAAAAGWIDWLASRGEQPEAARILVLDIGGGTLDVALVDVSAAEEAPEFRVLSSGGTTLGGYKVDQMLANAIARSGGRDDLAEQIASRDFQITDEMAWLLWESERAKVLLSAAYEVPVDLSATVKGTEPITVRQPELEELAEPYVDEALRFALGVARGGLLTHGKTSDDVLRLSWGTLGITHVLLVGGGSRLSGFEAILKRPEILPEAVISTETAYIAAEEMVARGLIFASGNFFMSLDRPPFSIKLVVEQTTYPFYDAYEAMYLPQDTFANVRPAVRKTFQLPRYARQIRTVFESVGGHELRPENGRSLDWPLPSQAGHISATLYPDGRFLLRTERQPIVQLRLPNWNPWNRDFVTVREEPLGPMAMFENPFQEGAPG